MFDGKKCAHRHARKNVRKSMTFYVSAVLRDEQQFMHFIFTNDFFFGRRVPA